MSGALLRSLWPRMLSGPSDFLGQSFGISENDISEDCSVPSGIAKRLRPLTHGTPRETHIQKKAKIDPQEIEAQPVEEVKEEISQNCSDSEDSSGSQSSSIAEAEDIESDLESLEDTIAITPYLGRHLCPGLHFHPQNRKLRHNSPPRFAVWRSRRSEKAQQKTGSEQEPEVILISPNRKN